MCVSGTDDPAIVKATGSQASAFPTIAVNVFHIKFIANFIVTLFSSYLKPVIKWKMIALKNESYEKKKKERMNLNGNKPLIFQPDCIKAAFFPRHCEIFPRSVGARCEY